MLHKYGCALSWISLILFFPVGLFSVLFYYKAQHNQRHGEQDKFQRNARRSQLLGVAGIVCALIVVAIALASTRKRYHGGSRGRRRNRIPVGGSGRRRSGGI